MNRFWGNHGGRWLVHAPVQPGRAGSSPVRFRGALMRRGISAGKTDKRILSPLPKARVQRSGAAEKIRAATISQENSCGVRVARAEYAAWFQAY